jgi:nucleotide-binding universal stress UspA family protein
MIMTTKILALVDGSTYATSVCHAAAWIAGKLGGGVDLLHILPDAHAKGTGDLSGALTLGARTALMEELVTLDAQRAKLAAKQGHAILDDAAALLAADGVTPVDQKLRHGDLIETLTALIPDVRALVIGKRGEGSAGAFNYLGSNLERIIRSATVPVFVAAREFRPIDKVLIAFDGSASADRAVERMAQSPVFEGLTAVVVYAGADTPAVRSRMNAAQSRLSAGGLQASIAIEPGEPETALQRKITAEGFDLLVMGAYGHSRLRNLNIGSTTTTMIRACKVPVLLYR